MSLDNSADQPGESVGFCVVPWVHAHVNGEGKRGLCCVDSTQSQAIQPDRVVSLNEYWNGPYMRSIRTQMLSGKRPKECENCHLLEASNAKSMRTFLNEKYSEFRREAVARTSKDGVTTLQPFYFDYRSKACNFKCRTCGDHSSTSILKERTENSALRKLFPRLLDEGYLSYQAKARQFLAEVVGPELVENAREGKVKELYWAGGEPLLNGVHWQVLDELIRNGKSSEVALQYNTNLSFNVPLGQEWFNALPKFKSVQINVSLDGTGKLGEYIRFGLDYDQFCLNLRSLQQEALRHKYYVYIDVTLCSLTLLDLSNLVDLALRYQLPLFAKPMLHDIENAYMSPFFFPQVIQKRLIDRGLDKIRLEIERNSEVEPLLASFRGQLEGLRARDLSLGDNFRQWRNTVLAHLSETDRARSMSFSEHLKSEPDLSRWFAQYNHDVSENQNAHP